MSQHYYQSEERPIFHPELEVHDRNSKKTILIVLGMSFAIISLAALGKHISHDKNTNTQTDFHSKSIVKTPPSCSTIECYSTNCDKQLSPFLCTVGNAVGGCSNKASTWVNKEICTTSCDLRDCNAHAVVEDEANLPRHCNDCNAEQCEFLAKQFFQSCGNDAPYVCLEGANRYGCASNKYVWEAAVNTTCSECCNKLSCDK